jgi:D-alanyl-lipoteichoic acid acyltransferase DltB (MBOAT superfamily)
MTLSYIAAFFVLALLYGLLVPGRWRGWVVLGLSVLALYALQPLLPVRSLDFALPTATLVLTVATWWLTRPKDTPAQREDAISLAVIVLLVLGLAATRYLSQDLRITPSRPPEPLAVALVLAVVGAVGLALWRVVRIGRWSGLLSAMIGLIVVIFVILKAEPLAVTVSGWLRGFTGQQATEATFLDLQWLGFSYVAFRLIHTLRDRQTGRLPALTLREYAAYVLFFPALTAGPIDRAERFASDFRALATQRGLDSTRLVMGSTRIGVGLFKKFVIADSLALFSLNAANAAQADAPGAMWLLLYAYAFRLFFDFSGYTDIAIGIGILFGIRLPENFDRPYLRQNITLFWQSWHITLGNWARFYAFSPLSRALLKRKPRPSMLLIVLVAQLATMLTIGLWHGVTANFILWGLWHGIGLFVHKAWSDRTRAWYLRLNERPALRNAWTVVGVLLTFHFVVLSWVWFAVPDFASALQVYARLLGIG